MMTAMLCVENILADTKLYDLWQVNGDAEYHEAGEARAGTQGTLRFASVPTRVATSQQSLASERDVGARGVLA